VGAKGRSFGKLIAGSKNPWSVEVSSKNLSRIWNPLRVALITIPIFFLVNSKLIPFPSDHP